MRVWVFQTVWQTIEMDQKYLKIDRDMRRPAHIYNDTAEPLTWAYATRSQLRLAPEGLVVRVAPLTDA